MQTRTWLMGLKTLVLAFPDRDQTEAVQEERGQLYQRHLADLTDEQWTYAVREAVKYERWFPSVAALRDYAEAARPQLLALPPPPRTEAELEADRAATKRGLALVKAAVAKRLGEVPPLAPLGEARTEVHRVVAHGDRLAELKRQAQEIQAEQPAEVKA